MYYIIWCVYYIGSPMEYLRYCDLKHDVQKCSSLWRMGDTVPAWLISLDHSIVRCFKPWTTTHVLTSRRATNAAVTCVNRHLSWWIKRRHPNTVLQFIRRSNVVDTQTDAAVTGFAQVLPYYETRCLSTRPVSPWPRNLYTCRFTISSLQLPRRIRWSCTELFSAYSPLFLRSLLQIGSWEP